MRLSAQEARGARAPSPASPPPIAPLLMGAAGPTRLPRLRRAVNQSALCLRCRLIKTRPRSLRTPLHVPALIAERLAQGRCRRRSPRAGQARDPSPAAGRTLARRDPVRGDRAPARAHPGSRLRTSSHRVRTRGPGTHRPQTLSRASDPSRLPRPQNKRAAFLGLRPHPRLQTGRTSRGSSSQTLGFPPTPACLIKNYLLCGLNY